MSKNVEIAKEIKAMADRLGWKIARCSGSILTIEKVMEPATNDAFVRADSEYYSILGLMPTTSPGSVWGTDGGGMGALSAMNSGVFRMNKSGCSVRVLNQLAKLV